MKRSFWVWVKKPRRVTIVSASGDYPGQAEIKGVWNEKWKTMKAIYDAVERRFRKKGVRCKWFQYHSHRGTIVVSFKED
jgi:hypothetical protein